MAKKQSTAVTKQTFGKRRGGKAQKRLNKHKSVKAKYRGQGR